MLSEVSTLHGSRIFPLKAPQTLYSKACSDRATVSDSTRLWIVTERFWAALKVRTFFGCCKKISESTQNLQTLTKVQHWRSSKCFNFWSFLLLCGRTRAFGRLLKCSLNSQYFIVIGSALWKCLKSLVRKRVCERPLYALLHKFGILEVFFRCSRGKYALKCS